MPYKTKLMCNRNFVNHKIRATWMHLYKTYHAHENVYLKNEKLGYQCYRWWAAWPMLEYLSKEGKFHLNVKK